ncbi:hypothetical protein BH23ACT9_BH23ACT9_10270 [soil metagenome]
MTSPTLQVSRAEVLAFRLRAGGLGRRLPRDAEALRRASWAGAQDSMPRAALLSLHARVGDIPSPPAGARSDVGGGLRPVGWYPASAGPDDV